MHKGEHISSKIVASKKCISAIEYRLAHELYQKESYSDSLDVLKKAINEVLSSKNLYKEGPTLRDGIILSAWNYHQLRRYEDCVTCIRNAINNGQVEPDDPEASLLELWVSWAKCQYKEVLVGVEQIINSFTEVLHPLLAEYLFLRGSTLIKLGEVKLALDDCESAHTLFKLQNKCREQAIVANVIGNLMLGESRYLESLNWFEKSLYINIKLQLSRRIGVNYLNYGIAYYKFGNYDKAFISINKSIAIFQKHETPSSLCRAHIALGNVCRLQCDYPEARKNLMAAYTLATKQRIPREECLALEFLGDVFRDEGKPEEALRYYTRGLAIAKKIAPEGDLVMELWRREGECLEQMDKIAEAMPILAQARTLAQKLGDRFELGVIQRCLAVCVSRISDWNSAHKYISESIKLLEDIDAQHELAISYLHAAHIYSSQAEDAKQDKPPQVLLEDAWGHAMTAQHLFSKLDLEEWLEKSKLALSVIAKKRVAESRYNREQDRPKTYPTQENHIIAVSMAMRNVLQLCDAFARYDEPILITGETGTGKELIAQRLHEFSNRKDKTLVALNMAAIPATMFEREFFGHHKGAFSGADRDLPGYAAEANGGTLFLDEISELSLELQPKLLRLLQEGTYTALGDPELKHADVRLIAATNANLRQLVESGEFRQDLYYRLRVLEIDIPPLRQRPEDIVPLLNHFLSLSAGRKATVSEFFDEISIRAMLRFPWGGNVREVAMVARRAHISMEAEGRVRVNVGIPPNTILLTGPEQVARAATAGTAEDDVLRSRIMVLLEETGGNRSETARRLGIARPTLYRWMARLGINR